MKKLKVSFLAVAAILLGICGSAFTTAEPVEKSTLDGWFIYNGGDLDDPNSYTYTTNIAPCNASVQFCAFNGNRQAVPNQSRPTIESLENAMGASSDFEDEVPGLVIFKP